MQRNILRAVALTTVVGLGVFAIIQAQRQAGNPALAADSGGRPSADAPGAFAPTDARPLAGAGSEPISGPALAGDPNTRLMGGMQPTAVEGSATGDVSAQMRVLSSPRSASVVPGGMGQGTAPPTMDPASRYRAIPLAPIDEVHPPVSDSGENGPPPVASGAPFSGIGYRGDQGTMAPVTPAESNPMAGAGPVGGSLVEDAPTGSTPPAHPPGIDPQTALGGGNNQSPGLRADPFADSIHAMPMPGAGIADSGDAVSEAPDATDQTRGLNAALEANGLDGFSGGPSPLQDVASATTAGSADEGSGRPGAANLEGPQSPQVTIQKIAPPEVQVGKPAPFRIVVRNTGQVPAVGVEVHDQVPKGAKVVSTNPRASHGVRGDLVWTLGTLKPGEEIAVEVQLMPVAEGELGSVASVHLSADASAKTIATRPQLMVETTMAEHVLVGEELLLKITVSNPGTGVATGVVLEEHVPQGMQHPAGAELEYEVGELRPGESRDLELVLSAAQPGRTANMLFARADGGLRVENRRELEVTAPQLDLVVNGPKKRYLEREAVYQVSVANPGTAPAEGVELVAYLPAGLRFVSANNSGYYDEANQAVHWRLEQLPVQETGSVELVTMPVEAGEQNIKLRGTAAKGLIVEREHAVLVEGLAAILFQAADTVDPVEVGGETTYEIRVVNQGSKAATNVRLAVSLPPELSAVAADGPTRNEVQGNQVLFEGLARLGPKADTTYRVRVQGAAPGDLRTRIQLMTDEMQTPVTKEESTRVYADE